MNYLIALLLGVVIGGAGSWKATSMHYEHLASVAAREAQQKVDAANQRAENAASDWEVWASLQKPKTVTLIREVEREIAADSDCSTRALPDGLRDSLTRAGADHDQPVVADAVPAAPAATAGDFWGRAARLFRGADGAAGVPQEAQGAR